LLQLSAKRAVMQALSITDCPAEPHLLPMWRVKKFWQNVPAAQAWKPVSVIGWHGMWT